MNKYLAIINVKTFISVFISILATYFSYQYHIIYNIDLTLVSIAIVFPLVFSIRSSFRRREKALEHLSQFSSAIKTIGYHFSILKNFPEDKKNEVSSMLSEVSNAVIDHLKNKDTNTQQLDETINKIHVFTLENTEFFSKGFNEKILKYLNKFHEAVDNLNAIHSHRTPISLKAYCLVFIYIFPFVYTPSMINKIGIETTVLVPLFIVSVSQFFLISLYNIQDHMEYPFDQNGLDDIKMDQFKLDKS